jgi:hypothetical protein
MSGPERSASNAISLRNQLIDPFKHHASADSQPSRSHLFVIGFECRMSQELVYKIYAGSVRYIILNIPVMNRWSVFLTVHAKKSQ